MFGSILAGFCIGIACIFYILAPNPLIGALLFGLGLMNIRLMKYKLFTGKVQRILDPEFCDGGMFQTFTGITGLFLMFILNFIGIAAAFALGAWIPGVIEGATIIATSKLALDGVRLFAQSILCGYLMTIATRPSTPLWMTPLCVFAFVYLGLNHCVADSFYYLTGITEALPNLGITIAGNFFGGLAGALNPPAPPTQSDTH